VVGISAPLVGPTDFRLAKKEALKDLLRLKMVLRNRDSKGDPPMPLNEIPKFFKPETRALIESSLEDAWQELKKDRLGDTAPARMRLARTIVGSCFCWRDEPNQA